MSKKVIKSFDTPTDIIIVGSHIEDSNSGREMIDLYLRDGYEDITLKSGSSEIDMQIYGHLSIFPFSKFNDSSLLIEGEFEFGPNSDDVDDVDDILSSHPAYVVRNFVGNIEFEVDIDVDLSDVDLRSGTVISEIEELTGEYPNVYLNFPEGTEFETFDSIGGDPDDSSSEEEEEEEEDTESSNSPSSKYNANLYKNLSDKELDEEINKALDSGDFDKVHFLSQFLESNQSKLVYENELLLNGYKKN